MNKTVDSIFPKNAEYIFAYYTNAIQRKAHPAVVYFLKRYAMVVFINQVYQPHITMKQTSVLSINDCRAIVH